MSNATEIIFVEDRKEGRMSRRVEMVCKKIIKGQNAVAIADLLEEDESAIQKIVSISGYVCA